MSTRSPSATASRPGALLGPVDRGGFTLIELIVTTMLTAVLLAALLNVTAGITRDRKRLASSATIGRPEAVVDLVRRDLVTGRTLGRSTDGTAIVIEGHGGLARGPLTPDGRLTRVTYRVRPAGPDDGRGSGSDDGGRGGRFCLVREQRYLDDPARPDPWAEVVAVGVRRFTITPAAAGGTPTGDAGTVGGSSDALRGTDQSEDAVGFAGGAFPIPAGVRLGVVLDTGAIDELIRVR